MRLLLKKIVRFLVEKKSVVVIPSILPSDFEIHTVRIMTNEMRIRKIHCVIVIYTIFDQILVQITTAMRLTNSR